MAAKQYLSKSGHGTPWWAIGGLIALLVVDAVLVWLALSATRDSDDPSAAAPSATFAPTPTIPASATPPATTAPDYEVAAPSVVLAAFDASVAYRAVTGPCPATPGAIEATADGGATWASAALPEASTPVAIAATSATEAVAVAAAASDCAPLPFRTFVGGAEWAAAPAAEVWRLAGADVVSPDGRASTPCAGAPVQVSGANADAAAVLCDDALVGVTADAGATWSPSQPISGAAAVAMAPDGAVRVLLAAQGDCAGVQVADVGRDGELGGIGECVTTDAADGASTIAADTSGGVWLWSGAVVARSSDGGATW